MEKKTASDMRAYLSSFEPEYPVKKGYIARLIVNEKLATADICRMIKDMVQVAEPDKQIHEGRVKACINDIKKNAAKKMNYTAQWADLVNLNQQSFCVSFLSEESLMLSAATSPSVVQPDHTCASLIQTDHSSTSLIQTDHSFTPLIQTDHSSTSLIQTDYSSATLIPADHTTVPLIQTDHGQCTSATPWVNDELPSNFIHNESLSIYSRSPSPKRLRKDCDNCVAKQRTSMNMLKENRELRLRIRALRIRHREEKKKMALKTLNVKIKRKSESAENWRAKHTNLNTKYRKQEKLHMAQEMKIILKHDGEINALKEKLKKSDENNTDLQNRHKQLEDQFVEMKMKITRELQKVKTQLRKEIENSKYWENKSVERGEIKKDADSDNIVTTKEAGKYDHRFRQCVYDCLMYNVSVGNISSLLSSVAGIVFGKQFQQVPCVTTIAQMAYELGVLASVQAGQMLHECDLITLAWDSTTKGGIHYNEVHVFLKTTLGRQSFTLNIRPISGSSAEELYQHATEAFSDVCEIYCAAFQLPAAAILDEIKSKLHSTMSDRAAANHRVSERLKEDFGDGDVADLKCMVHPLDGLARSARDALRKLDRMTNQDSQQTSLGCQAATLIHQVSKLRYKDGSGDPAAFTAFLKTKNINPNIFKRYVGNRLNVMFSMAAVIFLHRAPLTEFVKYRQRKFLCSKIYEGLTDPNILLHLQVLGMYSRFLTGPWMQLFYTEENAQGHFEAVEEVKTCLGHLATVEKTPEYLIQAATDAFDRNMEESELTKLHHATKDYNIVAKNLASAFLKTLTNQFKTNFKGPLAKPSKEMIARTSSAPVHNMGAERIMAMLDAALQRAPNATIGFIDAKVKAVQNKTLDWLQSFDDGFQKFLVRFAIRYGSKVRQHQAEQKKKIQQQAVQGLDKTKRDVYEKQLLDFVPSGLVLSVLDLQIFKDLDLETKERLQNILYNSNALTGVSLRHIWYEGGVDTAYIEMVKHVKEKGSLKTVIEVWYWKENEEKTDATFKMTLCQFLVDFATKELSFYVD